MGPKGGIGARVPFVGRGSRHGGRFPTSWVFACASVALFGSGTDPLGLSTDLYGMRIGLPTVGSVSLCCAAFEVGALLDGDRLMSNVTDDMSLGLEYHVTALDWSFYPTVHDDLLRCDTFNDLSI